MKTMGKDRLEGNTQRVKECSELIRRAQQQPGVKELSQAYGYYDRLVRQSNAYLAITRPKVILSTTNSS
jgi:hypothetical protein